VKDASTLPDQSPVQLAALLRQRRFDAAVIFTVFSQNPLPTALILHMAGIRNILAYCRENPYQLLAPWIPDEEPYHLLRHQVKRDLDLVASVGAFTDDDTIRLRLPENAAGLSRKLKSAGVDELRPWLILHPGVSEEKRQYPVRRWIEAGKMIADKLNYQILITGIAAEAPLAKDLAGGMGAGAVSLAGCLHLEEFILLIKGSPLLISVNTSSVHIAAALRTPTIVLYALTNPQHAPWKATGKVLPFSVPAHLRSRNEVLRFVQARFFTNEELTVSPEEIYTTTFDTLVKKERRPIPEIIMPRISSADQEHLVLP
jgi:ADP-heptose:LPS heptosyltransferase